MSTTSATTTHCAPATVDASWWVLNATPGDDLDEDLVRLAALGARDLPLEVDEAIVRFASESHRSGALLIRNAPIGQLPPTPATPESPVEKDLATELTLLTVARRFGQPVGYVPEHGGRIVQNIVPTRTDTDRQTSTSSRSNLMFHTETAFHPFRPRYLLLLCLRGDPSAHTTLVSVHELMDRLPDDESRSCSSRDSARRSTPASSGGGPTNSDRPGR
jgi:L-asparagine oxygenase